MTIGFMASIDSSLIQQVFNVARHAKKSVILHRRQSDDLAWRVEDAKWILWHPSTLESGQGGLIWI